VLGFEGFRFGDGADEGPFAAGAVAPPGAPTVDPPLAPPTDPPAELPPALPPAPAASTDGAVDIVSARPNPSAITSCFFILTRCSRTFASGDNSARFVAFRREVPSKCFEPRGLRKKGGRSRPAAVGYAVVTLARRLGPPLSYQREIDHGQGRE
jgi:hypothetical protein